MKKRSRASEEKRFHVLYTYIAHSGVHVVLLFFYVLTFVVVDTSFVVVERKEDTSKEVLFVDPSHN